MAGRRVRIVVGVMVAMLALGAGTAMGAKVLFGASHGKRSLAFTLNTGKQRIVGFSFDNLKCGDGRATASLPDAVRIKSDRSFKSEQSVTTDEGLSLVVKLKGSVNRDATEVNGKLNLTGDCKEKGSFTAVPQKVGAR